MVVSLKRNVEWNWNIDSRDNGKMDIVPLDSYFPRYTLLTESIILKEDIGNYQLLMDFDRTKNAESALSKISDLQYLTNYNFTS